MIIPIRAFYARGTKPGEEPQLISAEYADVPTELIAGTLAQAGVDIAFGRGDTEGAQILSNAIGRARADGKIKTL